jgi:hypothetical protein
VVQGVVDLDDLPVHLQAVGDVGLAAEHGGDGLGQRGLAVARRPVEEERARRVHRRAQLLHDVHVHHQVRQRDLQVLLGDDRVLGGLAGDERVVLLDGHRRGADVGGALERVAGVLAALLGEDEVHGGAAVALAAAQVDELLGREEVDDLVHHAGPGQPHLLGYLHAAAHAPVVQELDGDLGQQRQPQARLLERPGLGRAMSRIFGFSRLNGLSWLTLSSNPLRA